MENTLWIDLAKLAAVALLVGANAFFVAAEFALISVRRTRVDELVALGNHPARWVHKAIAEPDRFIAATQLGITLASLGLGWIAEPALGHLLEPVVQRIPEALRGGASPALAAAFAFAVITFLHVVAGELMPRSIALQSPERTALVVARPTVWAARLFQPAIWLLNGAGNLLLRPLGVQPANPRALVHSVDELKRIVAASTEGGVVEADEQEMLHAVFDLGHTLVRQLMVPRTEMEALPAEAPLETIIAAALRTPHTRFPVYEGTPDHVIGVLHLHDVLRAAHGDRAGASTARGLMREAIFVPENATITALLRRFRLRRRHLAIVVDEYGGTAGIITLEDLLEQIIGEVSDEFGQGPGIQPLPDGSALIDGLTLIEEVNQHFQLRLHDPHYDTIAGYVLGRLGRLAQVGDVVVADGARLRVEALDGRRIARLSLFPQAGAPAPPGG